MVDCVELLLDLFDIVEVDSRQSVELFYPLPVALYTLLESRLVNVLNDGFYVALDVVFHDLNFLQRLGDEVLFVDWYLLIVIKQLFQQLSALHSVKLYDLFNLVHRSFKNFRYMLINLFNTLFARGSFLQAVLALINAAKEEFQDLELRMSFEVGIAGQHGTALADIESSAAVSGVDILKLNRKSLAFKFDGTLFTVKQVLPLNVYAISTIKLLMIFAMSFKDFAGSSAFGPLPGQTQRRLRIIMRRQSLFGG